MSKIIRIASSRKSNLDVTPKELIECIVDDLNDNPKIKTLFVIGIEAGEDGGFIASTWRAGLKWEQEVAITAWAHHKALHRDFES